jgi:hypothetical protein
MTNIDKIKEIKKFVSKYDLSELAFDTNLQLEVLCKIDDILCEAK